MDCGEKNKASDHSEGHCVLAVDDDSLNIKLFTTILAAAGYRVLQAEDAYHAIDIAYQEQSDLIVMDIQLPDMSGLEATRQLKNDAATCNIPILIATAFLIDAKELRASGCNGYLAKPFTRSEFLKAIESLLATAAEKYIGRPFSTESP